MWILLFLFSIFHTFLWAFSILLTKRGKISIILLVITNWLVKKRFWNRQRKRILWHLWKEKKSKKIGFEKRNHEVWGKFMDGTETVNKSRGYFIYGKNSWKRIKLFLLQQLKKNSLSMEKIEKKERLWKTKWKIKKSKKMNLL